MVRVLKSCFFYLRYLQLKISNKNLIIGKNFKCGVNCSISKKNTIKIGSNFFMGRNCHLAANMIVGDNVMFASYVSFVGGDHRIDNIDGLMNSSGRDELKTIYIEDNVWIGHGAIIMHGITIKTGSVVASGAIVTKDVEENMIVGGNPAKEIRMRQL